MGSGRKYDEEYKVNAVKLAEKIGSKKAADELGIPDNTLYGWVRAAKLGHLNVGTGYRTPEDNLNLAEENAQLRKQLKEQEKEIKRLRETLSRYGIVQSMNSAGGRCHDNARCESMWARMKEELFYCRGGSEQYTIEELKHIIWVYYMSYWNNRRICSSIGGIPPAVKRKRYYEESSKAVG